jgi:TonB family protein
MKLSCRRFFMPVLCICICAVSSRGQEAAPKDTSDKQVTVPTVKGVFIKSIPGAPFSGTVEIVSRQKLPDGSVFTLKTINYIARDSRGRTYNETRGFVAASYEKEPRVTSRIIYDPAINLRSNLDPLTRIVRQTRTTEPPWPDASSIPDVSTAPLGQTDLGNRTFKGMVLHGIRQSHSAGESTEFWYSPDLSIYVTRKHQDSIWDQTVNVTDLDRSDPDPSLFVVPYGYRVVETQETRTGPEMTKVAKGIDILSDTKGVDFGPYVEQVKKATLKSWMPLIPESARPPVNKQGRVGILFKIYPDGSVKSMILEFPSGDVSLDRAAWGGITGASPFPPLPIEFSGPFLELRFGFFYNLDPSVFQ